MNDNFNIGDLKWAAKVSEYMMVLSREYIGTDRHERAMRNGLPSGDLPYGAALNKWHTDGCPSNAVFSYAPGQRPCSFLMEFRVEISSEFKLPIKSSEEAEEWCVEQNNLITTKVYDWGPN